MVYQMLLRTAAEPNVVNIVANGLVNPRRSIAHTQMREPTTIYGLRRPKRDLELSARTPATLSH